VRRKRSIAVGVQRVASRGVGCCHFPLLVGEKSVWRAAATACAHPPGVVEVTRGISSTAERRRRGLLRWAPATKRWRSQETAHAGALSQGGSARMLLHSMPSAGALTRPSSSGGSSSRSPSFPSPAYLREAETLTPTISPAPQPGPAPAPAPASAHSLAQLSPAEPSSSYSLARPIPTYLRASSSHSLARPSPAYLRAQLSSHSENNRRSHPHSAQLPSPAYLREAETLTPTIRSRGIKEEKRIAWFPWPPTTQRSIDSRRSPA
jgi:hypothetical protein